ncbi:30S ribosomal protein S18 [Candidatus Omnitrophota bacterium]
MRKMKAQDKKPRFNKRDDFLPRDVRKKVCRFCREKVDIVDYKDINRLQKFMTGRGKIVSRRLSGNCAKHQRKVSEAIKRARFLALMPYIRI